MAAETVVARLGSEMEVEGQAMAPHPTPAQAHQRQRSIASAWKVG